MVVNERTPIDSDCEINFEHLFDGIAVLNCASDLTCDCFEGDWAVFAGDLSYYGCVSEIGIGAYTVVVSCLDE